MKTELEYLIQQYDIAMVLATKKEGDIQSISSELNIKNQFINKVKELVEKENDNESRILGAKLFKDFCNKKKKEKECEWVDLCNTGQIIGMPLKKQIEMSQPIPKECRCAYIIFNQVEKQKVHTCNHCKEMEEAWKRNDEILKANKFREQIIKSSQKEILQIIDSIQECADYVFNDLKEKAETEFKEKAKELENSIEYKRQQFERLFGKLK